MRRPFHLSPYLLAAVLAAGACGRPEDVPPTADPGHLVVVWRSGGRLMDAPAEATYCVGDSLLLIVAIDRRWGAGLVLHGRFPVDTARSFAIRPSPAGAADGTANAAFRSVADSVHRAVVALRGSVRLEPGPRATGSFEVGGAPLPGHSEPVHLVGAFRDLPTADSSVSCGAWVRTP